MRQVTISTAKADLTKLIDATLAGEEIVIARDGSPALRLVPVARGTRRANWPP